MHGMKKFLLALMLCLSVFGSGGCAGDPWQKSETENLVIHYMPGTFAERDLERAKREYEDSYRALTGILPHIQLEKKIKVYLHEDLDKMGYSRAARREVHFQYNAHFRLTSMHEFMHIFLYEFNRHAPLRFEEGVCRMDEVRSVRVGNRSIPIPLVQLAKRAPRAKWKMTEIFKDDYKTDEEGNVAAAFAAFARQELGEKRFWKFYSLLHKDDWQNTLEQAFIYPMGLIEDRFSEYMEQLPELPLGE